MLCNNKQIVIFFRFMRLFEANLFSVARIEKDYIHALIAWEDDCINGLPSIEDVQEVLWKNIESPQIDDALAVGEYAYEAGWINIDRIDFNEKELKQALGWEDERIEAAINRLFEVRVPMIDKGGSGDSFFFHE